MHLGLHPTLQPYLSAQQPPAAPPQPQVALLARRKTPPPPPPRAPQARPARWHQGQRAYVLALGRGQEAAPNPPWANGGSLSHLPRPLGGAGAAWSKHKHPALGHQPAPALTAGAAATTAAVASRNLSTKSIHWFRLAVAVSAMNPSIEDATPQTVAVQVTVASTCAGIEPESQMGRASALGGSWAGEELAPLAGAPASLCPAVSCLRRCSTAGAAPYAGEAAASLHQQRPVHAASLRAFSEAHAPGNPQRRRPGGCRSGWRSGRRRGCWALVCWPLRCCRRHGRPPGHS